MASAQPSCCSKHCASYSRSSYSPAGMVRSVSLEFIQLASPTQIFLGVTPGSAVGGSGDSSLAFERYAGPQCTSSSPEGAGRCIP